MSKFNSFKDMSDDDLRECYVPDVYQKSIYTIDYKLLKNAGVKLITFDIDDTLAGLEDLSPPKEAITKIEQLKNMGFELDIMSNTWESRAAHFAKILGIDGRSVERSEKPLSKNFKKLLDLYGLDARQMAHIGNSVTDDVAGGNAAGIITCLVRRAGIMGKVFSPEEPKLIDELKDRGIWCKHHKYEKGDQYYQLGEVPRYKENEQAEAYAKGMRSSENTYIKSLRDLVKGQD